MSLRFPDAPAAANNLESLSRALRTIQTAKHFTVPDTESLPAEGHQFELLTLNTGGTGALVWWDGSAWQTVAGVATLTTGYVPVTRTISTTSPLTGGGDLSANLTLSMPAAGSGQSGYLTSADWAVFNAKVSATRAVNTTAPLAGGGALNSDRTLSITLATTSTDGYLSSTDWNTFNNKAPTANPSFTGIVRVATSNTSASLNVSNGGSPTNAGTLGYFGSGTPTASNLYGIYIGRDGTEAILTGINKNTTTGSVPANSAFFSTYVSGGTWTIGRGNSSGLPNTADLHGNGSGDVCVGTATSAGAKLNVAGNIYPVTDNTYYLGKNSASTPFAWKGLILKDQSNGNYYRIEMIAGVLTPTAL